MSTLPLSLVSSCLTHVNQETELAYDNVDEAFQQAELFTNLGFEVSTPTFDGNAFIFIINR